MSRSEESGASAGTVAWTGAAAACAASACESPSPTTSAMRALDLSSSFPAMIHHFTEPETRNHTDYTPRDFTIFTDCAR